MAIIPLGPLTMPSMCKFPIISPGLPGGRLSGVPLPAASLASSGENGSRRAMFSFTGTIAGSASAFGISLGNSLGSSAFTSAAALGLGVVEISLLFAAPGFKPFARTPFAPGVAATVLIGGVPPGLNGPCDSVDAAGALGPTGPDTGFIAGAKGRLIGAVAAAIGLAFCAAAGDAADVAGLGACAAGAGAAAAGFGAGVWPSRLRTLVRTDGDCCAAAGIPAAARHSTAIQLVRLPLRMFLSRNRIVGSILPF